MNINLFAYGSNISEHRMRVERKINFISRKFAILKNYKLEFNKVSKNNVYLGYANIVENINGIVEGSLYEIREEDLIIIDRYEGFPNHYNRIMVKVVCENKEITAVTYIANPSMIRENIKPDKKYLNYILEGKDLFSSQYYENLKNTKTLD